MAESTWGQEIIKKRSEIIAKEAVKVWSADSASLKGKVLPKIKKTTAKKAAKKVARVKKKKGA